MTCAGERRALARTSTRSGSRPARASSGRTGRRASSAWPSSPCCSRRPSCLPRRAGRSRSCSSTTSSRSSTATAARRSPNVFEAGGQVLVTATHAVSAARRCGRDSRRVTRLGAGGVMERLGDGVRSELRRFSGPQGEMPAIVERLAGGGRARSGAKRVARPRRSRRRAPRPHELVGVGVRADAARRDRRLDSCARLSATVRRRVSGSPRASSPRLRVTSRRKSGDHASSRRRKAARRATRWPLGSTTRSSENRSRERLR